MDGTKTESIVYRAASEHLQVMKTDRLSEAWRAKQQLAQRTVASAGLMAEERSPCGHDPGRNNNEAGLDQRTVEHGNAVGNMSACE